MENILPRREARENAFLLAFSQTFGDIPLQEALDNHHECDEEHPVDVFGQRLLRAYYEHSAEVDDLISAHLRNWTMERLPRVSLTVLRLGLAEMLYGDEKKPGVVINEAVELTKKYGADEDYQFVNGDPSDYRHANILVINRFHGVARYMVKGITKYRATIHINGNYIVGTYSSEEKAAIAYNKAADLAKAAGIQKNFPENYIDTLSPKEYAEIYTKIKLSERYLSYLKNSGTI